MAEHTEPLSLFVNDLRTFMLEVDKGLRENEQVLQELAALRHQLEQLSQTAVGQGKAERVVKAVQERLQHELQPLSEKVGKIGNQLTERLSMLSSHLPSANEPMANATQTKHKSKRSWC